jgi:hypothetical protein
MQLGKYAHEEEMPVWLIKLLEKKGAVRASGKTLSSSFITHQGC